MYSFRHVLITRIWALQYVASISIKRPIAPPTDLSNIALSPHRVLNPSLLMPYWIVYFLMSYVQDGRTVFMNASLEGRITTVQFLMNAGASMDAKDKV